MGKEIRQNVKLKMLLFERDISQKRLAFQIGVDPPRLSDAIRYGITTPDLRKKISRALGVKEEEIFSSIGNEKSSSRYGEKAPFRGVEN